MNNSASSDHDSIDEESLTREEELLIQLMDQLEQGQEIRDADIPAEFRKNPEFMRLLDCARQLESLAIPNPNLVSDFESDSSLAKRLPREFGPYTLLEELGRGGMGVVYRAQHRTLKSDVALKMIRTSEFASQEEVRRFFQEARAASRLKHSNIVNVHDAGELDGLPYLVMQHVDGESLAERLRHSRFTIDESVEFIRHVAEAVEYLNDMNVIHRDLKPSNILIDQQGRPYVTDFGLAKVFDVDAESTTTGTVIGTPAYMPPEQAWGTPEDVTNRSDIYSLGAILYELLTGQSPFASASPLDQILLLRDVDPPKPRSLNPDIPIELEQVCLRCLEKNPKYRYATAKELAADLKRYQDAIPINLPPIGIRQHWRRWIRREPALVAHWSAFAIMALIVQFANFLVGERRSPYLPVMTVLLIWTTTVWVLQKLLHRNVNYVRLIWVAVDVSLFTAAVIYAEGPVELLVVGYALLIVASSMWFQPELVGLMTCGSVIAYIVLISIRGAEGIPVHYHLIVMGILTVVGVITGTLVSRIRFLLRNRT